MLECIMREKERKREERKTKVLNIYSRLQDSGPLQPSRNRGRSKFEDCECISVSIHPHTFKTQNCQPTHTDLPTASYRKGAC